MRAAIFALTEAGAELALRVRLSLSEAEVFLPARFEARFGERARYFTAFGPAMREAFARYELLIAIMATGITVRTLAPCLKDKLKDSAVLALDECGKFVISLLSGHIGGGNGAARRLAAFLGAAPVITTATDAEGLLAPDAVAASLSLSPYPRAHIKELNSALLAGERISYFVSESLPHKDFYLKELGARGLLVGEEASFKVVLTEKIALPPAAGTLYLVPGRLIAGVGCRRGVSPEEVMAALGEACARVGRDVSFIEAIASASIKSNEEGLLAAARALGVSPAFYETEALQEMVSRYALRESEFVKRTVGVGSVCEPAALAAAREGARVRFALPKTKFGKVTVALLWESRLR